MPSYICGPGVSCDLIVSYVPTNLGSYISRVIAWVRHMGLDQYIDLLAFENQDRAWRSYSLSRSHGMHLSY
jgi:hypothetical protein